MLHINALTRDDLDAALRLSTQAGWNQLRADWRRLLALWPDGCLAGRSDDGELIATATLATYPSPTGTLGWVGMVLVDEAHRGQGHGGAMLDAVLTLADARGVARLGLDATDAGRPVYLKRGFRDVGGIDRWAGEAGLRPFHGPGRVLQEWQWPALLALDAAAFGASRAPLLQWFRQGGAEARVIEFDGRLAAFGFRRDGRTALHIGPVVAETPELAAQMTAALTLTNHGTAWHDGPIVLDVMRDGPLAPSLTEMGFAVARQLTRMVRASSGAAGLPEPVGPRAFVPAGFELG